MPRGSSGVTWMWLPERLRNENNLQGKKVPGGETRPLPSQAISQNQVFLVVSPLAPVCPCFSSFLRWPKLELAGQRGLNPGELLCCLGFLHLAYDLFTGCSASLSGKIDGRDFTTEGSPKQQTQPLALVKRNR